VYVKLWLVVPLGSNANNQKLNLMLDEWCVLQLIGWKIEFLWWYEKDYYRFVFFQFFVLLVSIFNYCRELLINVWFFYMCICSNFQMMEIYSNQWFWIILCISSKVHVHHLQKHIMLHNCQHTIPLIFFLKITIHDGGHMCEMVSLIIWNEKDMFQNEHLLQEIWIFHHVFCNTQFCYG
jgi:hypothetical protein